MLSTMNPDALSVLNNFVRIAQVQDVIDAQRIQITLLHDSRTINIWASYAMGNQPLPVAGDQVLIVGETLENSFIIGHIPAQPKSVQNVSLVQDKKNGKTILSIPEGDLDICAEKGSIRLQASKDIELNSKQLSMETGKAEFNVVDASYQGLRLAASVAHTKLFLGKLQSNVGRLIEKAKNVYRQVENLNQLKAGRMRTLVKGSYHLKGENINQKAEKDVRIDGDKINLG